MFLGETADSIKKLMWFSNSLSFIVLGLFGSLKVANVFIPSSLITVKGHNDTETSEGISSAFDPFNKIRSKKFVIVS